MISLYELEHYLNTLLQVDKIDDYAPNGLQVEGKARISKIVTGVTESQALIDAAIEAKADAVLVHHGYFWKGEDPCIRGMKKNSIAALLKNNISLFGYHLPLDVHEHYGNNVRLAHQLGFEIISKHESGGIQNLLWFGKLSKPQSLPNFNKAISKLLNREPLSISAGNHSIETIAWCTGGAQDYLEAANNLDPDAYISGEISERTVHIAREMDIH